MKTSKDEHIEHAVNLMDYVSDGQAWDMTRQARTVVEVPTLDPADVEVTTDKMGRPVVIIPDAVALALNVAREQGWREIPDVAWGDSQYQPHWSSAYAAVNVIFDVLAVSPGEELRVHDAVSNGVRYAAYYNAVVGRSAWDDQTSWWRDFPNDNHLHVHGGVHLDQHGVQWAG